MKTVLEFSERKLSGAKISMITCYDYTFARIIDASPIDCVLVGDSAGMVMHGAKDPLEITTEMLALHTRAVVRGCPNKLVIADLPFLSYRKGLTKNMTNIETIMRAGAQAVKLEGADGNLELVKHTVESGIPVVGHLGLTPQSVHAFGGFKVQGREERAQKKLIEDSKKLQDAGICALVLECIPKHIAKAITQELHVPTIGIGAGVDCDGQVLVLQDMLGLQKELRPKFLRKFFEGFDVVAGAFQQYHEAVQNQTFPSAKESYE